MPGRRLGALYSPFSLVVTLRTSSVAMFVIVTLADAMMAPDQSETWPDRVVPASWAQTVGSPDRRIKLREMTERNTVARSESRLGIMRTPLAVGCCDLSVYSAMLFL